MGRTLPSAWCSFIPGSLLSSIANFDGLSPDIRESAKRTIDEGDEVLNKAEALDETALQHVGTPKPLNRLIYDSNHEAVLPGDPWTLQELQQLRPTSYAKILYDIIGQIYEFFKTEFDYTLFDDQQCTIAVTMHYGKNYMNAHWTGRRVILGSGYEGLLDGFRYAKDVIVHELTHGIIMRSSRLQNFGETGALNEHLADVFGVLYNHYLENETFPSDVDAATLPWSIGEELWSFENYRWMSQMDMGEQKPSTNPSSPSFSRAGFDKWKFRKLNLPKYVRSFADPTSTNPAQPIDYRDFEKVTYDNGGVHLNSGIPNYAFYTAAVTAIGPTWQGIGKVWFCAMTERNLQPNCTFATFAAFTIAYAARDQSWLVEPIRKGWETVKVAPMEIDGIEKLLSVPKKTYVPASGSDQM